MYAVSETWARAQDHFLAPEGLVEISCYIPALKETLVYRKKDLLKFTHQQTGCLVSGELPKNHIEFSLDNSDDKWNPSNPKGMERFLSDRLKLILRYGLLIDGVEHWIPGGVFYLSEWHTSANGLEASFKARDVLEYMIDVPYTGNIAGTLYDIAKNAVIEAKLPDDTTPAVLGESRLGEAVLGRVNDEIVSLSEELKNFTVGDIEYDGTETIAVILQKCANAAGCVMYQDRAGVFTIGKLRYSDSGYVIPKRLSYAYPEVEFSRPIKNVSVTYYDGATTVYPFSSKGETQTLDNEFILTKVQADAVAKWVCDSLRSRQQISSEFRGDPRFDLFDVVDVESKYGTIAGVVLTDIKCSFTGAFRISYSGYVRGNGVAATVYCGELFAGEVV
ncbi:hypothetical protein [Succinimonas sp.]|uniref:hypothetical protein n=1 Tax=Succinimonas sp. TaxID=1936151 RepID=UPI00386D40EE